MEALYLLIPLGVLLVFAAIWVFFTMSNAGQFDDMVGPAWRILQDDDRAVLVGPNSGAEIAPNQASRSSTHLVVFDSDQGF